MEFSAWPSVTNPWPVLLEEARHIDETGWRGLWIGDHFMPNQADNSGPWQESWTVLAALAASTSRVRLGTLVTGNTYRNPCILAKQAAQVDIISGGRLTLGMGAGWQENEHVAYDIPYYTAPIRLQRLEESLQILRGLFDNKVTSFEGRYYHVIEAPLAPKPVQPRLPILIGGGGEKVTLRLVAQYADAWNVTGPAEVVAQKSEVLRQHCERHGRDFEGVHRTAAMLVNLGSGATGGGLGHGRGWTVIEGLPDLVDALAPYAEAGVHEMIVHFNPRLPLERRKELLAGFMAEVAPAFT
jgi:F420-dependent oxidoreductase-like protein